MKCNWLSMPLAVLVTLTSSMVNAASSSNEIQYYCSGNGVEFQSSVSIGKGVRVHINQGSYSYLQDPLSLEPAYQFIHEQLVYVGGISSECASFIMTKGSKVLPVDGVIARIHFDFDSDELTQPSRYILNQLLERMKYAYNITLEGHTDDLGSKQYNFTLGADRAVAVSSYMQQHPNTPYKLIKVSKGETDPSASNRTEDGRYLNRRVDIKY